jgi:AcrR family transcriptional regulator
MKSGRVRQKLRTRRVLLESAAKLLAAGRRPSVTEAADAAGVSRRTAYRYFQTSERMLADAALEKLRPALESAIDASAPGASVGDVEARLDALVKKMQQLAIEHETLLRTMIHETVLAPAWAVEPRRGTRRLAWIESAVKPLRKRLGRGQYKRMVSALALCTGIEALLVLRDICGLSPGELTRVSQWMSRAIVRETLRGHRADLKRQQGTMRRS